MDTTILGIGLMILVQILKKIRLRFGKLGIHLSLLGIGILVALLQYGWTFMPQVQAEIIIGVWGSAVLAYEFLYKRIGRDLIGLNI